MPTQDQLEIIRASGEIDFYDIDPSRGITNIGRDPENDVVIDSPGVALFHAVLDHQQKPYRLMVLSEVGETTLGGQPLSPNVFTEIKSWDTIELDGHSIILLESEVAAARPAPAAAPVPVPRPVTGRPAPPAAGPPAPLAVAPAPAPPAVAPAPALPPETMVPAPAPAAPAAPPAPLRPVGLPARPSDQPDEAIVTELAEREWTIDVDQTATLRMPITNGGDIVAAFEMRVEGLNEEWVTISPPQINLYEGEREVVTIAITPPRLPSSRAGAHHFAVIVTSPNYPGRYSRRGATLFINPYYEFTVGELSPRQQTVSWFKRTGRTTVPVVNKGNSETMFRLDGADDERACSFEFQVPGETVSLATQAEMRVPPEETASIPVRITPHVRRLFALRKRTYSFTITTTMLEGAQTPRAVLGQLRSAPLIGFWHMLLMLFLLTAVVVFLFIPGANPRLYSEEGQRLAATDNLLTLGYNVSRFKGLSTGNLFNRINGVFLDVTIERKLAGAPDTTYEVVEASLRGPAGATNDTPTMDVVYRLTVGNWLSLIFSRLERTAFLDVSVVPVLPLIEVSPDQKELELGQPVTLSWSVQYAERLVLKTQDGLVIETFDEPEPTDSYNVQPETDTVYILEAHNLYTGDSPETDTATIKVVVPPPVIEFFVAQPNQIIEGTPVAFNWRVTGADSVTIESDDPVDRPVPVGPAGPPINRQPTRTTLYTLKAAKGEATAVAYQEVGVTPAPSPTPTPQAPVIEFFTASPDEVVKGDDEDVKLAWSVTGDTTNIEISSPDFGPVSGLAKKSDLSTTVNEATTFVLTAYNGDMSASKTVQVKALEPTPVPPPPTATPLPPNIVYFRAAAANSVDDDKVTFVSDNPPTYEVLAGTKINLSWEVQNATKVTLSLGGTSLGDQAFEGSLPQTVTSNGNYQLSARNAQDVSENAYLLIEMTQEIPPPPFDVQGSEDTISNTITITWKYDFDFIDDIEGFRIYRTDSPDTPVATEINLDAAALTPPYEWVDDTLTQTCDMGYYVVAVYMDIVDNRRKEVPSTSSWYSAPCP